MTQFQPTFLDPNFSMSACGSEMVVHIRHLAITLPPLPDPWVDNATVHSCLSCWARYSLRILNTILQRALMSWVGIECQLKPIAIVSNSCLISSSPDQIFQVYCPVLIRQTRESQHFEINSLVWLFFSLPHSVLPPRLLCSRLNSMLGDLHHQSLQVHGRWFVPERGLEEDPSQETQISWKVFHAGAPPTALWGK